MKSALGIMSDNVTHCENSQSSDPAPLKLKASTTSTAMTNFWDVINVDLMLLVRKATLLVADIATELSFATRFDLNGCKNGK